MSNSGAYLTIRHDPDSQEEIPLRDGPKTIGREAFNDIVVFDPEVSRRHAQISFLADQYLIEDLGSTNGTFVNGLRVTHPTPLHNGDVISMGEGSRLVFNWPAEAAQATMIKGGASQDLDKTVAVPDEMAGWQPEMAVPAIPDQGGATVAAIPGEMLPAEAEQRGPEKSKPKRDTRRYILGCGCLVIVLVFACAATLFLLDSLAADFLYCGPARPLFELFQVSCP